MERTSSDQLHHRVRGHIEQQRLSHRGGVKQRALAWCRPDGNRPPALQHQQVKRIVVPNFPDVSIQLSLIDQCAQHWECGVNDAACRDVASADHESAIADRILARLRTLLDETVRDQGVQQALHHRRAQVQASRDLAHTDVAWHLGQELQQIQTAG